MMISSNDTLPIFFGALVVYLMYRAGRDWWRSYQRGKELDKRTDDVMKRLRK